ncbi:MAG TPA: site-specific DNA-methyltransferase [Actinomycetota bacterium]|nr:site-specific DNA-methyltransferase [Actinomycetota bacterium]
MAQRREATQTSAFGVSRRENHDASPFYARFAAPELSSHDWVDPGKDLDRLFVGDARHMTAIADASVALVVTSPPYFAGKEYEEALGEGHIPATYFEYLGMLEEVFAECVRCLEPGGRIAVNVANLGRRPYRSLSSDVTAILQDKLRLLLRGEVIWQKGRGSSGSCAWGSFQRSTNPVLRDLTERVVIASKGRFDRAQTARRRAAAGLPSSGSLWRDEFMEATTDVWEIPPESATRVGHAAPFPVALPRRLIHLYTYYGDLVLDPFMGSGSTAIAALETGRHYAGYDIDPDYVQRAQARVCEWREQAAEGALESETPPVVLPPLPPAGETAPAEIPPPGTVAAAVTAGHAARDVARAALVAAGFRQVTGPVRLGGIEIALGARDATGTEWLFEVAGGFTSTRPGLRRTEALWKVLGKAAVVREVAPSARFGVLAAGLPEPGSSAAASLKAVCGVGKPIAGVFRLPGDQDPLARAAGGRGAP